MAYHKDFWVVIGTAAPVITLAAVVAFAQIQPSREISELRAFLAVMVLTASIVAEIFAFGQALLSLGIGHDLGLWIAGVLSCTGLLLAFIGSMTGLSTPYLNLSASQVLAQLRRETESRREKRKPADQG